VKGPAMLANWPTVKFTPLVTVNPVKGVTCPIAPLKLIFPAPAVKLKVWAPLIVLLNVIAAPVPPVFKATLLVKFTGEAKLIASLVVVIEPPSDTVQVPVWAKAPSRLNTVPFPMVRIFASVKLRVTGPVPVVVTFPLISIWLLEREIPEAPEVVSAPKEASPITFVTLMDAALMAVVVRFVAAGTEKIFNGVVPPRTPFN
jgi:hypothetical protein